MQKGEVEGETAKPKRRCSRGFVFMGVAVAFCLLLAVGTGLAIVFTSNASSRQERQPDQSARKDCDVTECVDVTLAVDNSIQDPTFNFSLTLTQVPRSNMVPLLEAAMDLDRRFKFTVTYFGSSLGYFLESLNGLEGDFAANRTYWMIANSSGSALPVGLSGYLPNHAETVRFIFTKSPLNVQHT